MEITIELSMYPLREEYKPAIIELINRLKSTPSIDVEVNPTSTHIYGEYDVVMSAIQVQVKRSFELYGKCVFVMKVLNGNLKESLNRLNL